MEEENQRKTDKDKNCFIHPSCQTSFFHISTMFSTIPSTIPFTYKDFSGCCTPGRPFSPPSPTLLWRLMNKKLVKLKLYQPKPRHRRIPFIQPPSPAHPHSRDMDWTGRACPRLLIPKFNCPAPASSLLAPVSTKSVYSASELKVDYRHYVR